MDRLYLLRHGTAEPASDDDESRALVDKGRAQVRQVAALLQRMGVVPQSVLASTYLRARQTAEELIAGLGIDEGLLAADHRLVPYAPVSAASAAVVEAAAALAPDATICAVGHEPLLSHLCAEIVGPGLQLQLRKGGLVELEIEDRAKLRGSLLGLLRPRHLRG